MELKQFRVTDFRSVKDSGWIDCQNITTLVGVNEAGKSNLLKALWKLKPARGGAIDELHDMPTSELSELKGHESTVPFIAAKFAIGESDVERICTEHKCQIENLTEICCKRYYDGEYEWGVNDSAKFLIEEVGDNPETASQDLTSSSTDSTMVDMPTSQRNSILEGAIPSFVYYSNYGNLSSHVYLPYAKKWLNGESVQGIDTNEDQVRTLKELFSFVHLEPDEIINLGRDPREIAKARSSYDIPNKQEIERAEKDKQERTILLNSAGSMLTSKFREWWRQGDYVFRLAADGDYLTIWVSDERRPTEVDLSDRSTGLQWFLSFFLVFLVEAHESNAGAILLLDEAGLSLHPKAQHDLIGFMEELSKGNQIIHTTHSPFLIDTDNIDRCVAIYVDDNGYTVASNNLRDGAGKLEENSIYAVHAALGLSVSDVLLAGCRPVIVEGPSDQYALSAIKQKLIELGKIHPDRELVFMPAGGNKGINAISGVLGAKDGLPPVILDGDKPGKMSANNLKKTQYKEDCNKIIVLSELLDMPGAEVEDLMPYSCIRNFIAKLFINVEDETFDDCYDPSEPIVNQIESFADKYNVVLDQGKWKVNMAKYFKNRISKTKDVDEKYLENWSKLFGRIVS